VLDEFEYGKIMGKRVEVEGKIGECKRRYNLGQIYEKLKPTSETAIALGILMTTLERILRDSFFALLLYNGGL
jgi:hypothetical protein